MATFVTTEHLDLFAKTAVEVLLEADPKRGMNSSEWLKADTEGVRTLHSQELRQGMADSLGMLGALGSGEIKAATADGSDPAVFANWAARELFTRARTDCETWLDLAPHLPALAEADPNELDRDVATVLGGPSARSILWRDWPSEASPATPQDLATGIEAVSSRVLDDVGLAPDRWGALIAKLDTLFPGHFDRAVHKLEEPAD
ncbi:MAG: hypothetical protein ACYC41_06360 [Bacillota bacterium]